MATSLGVILAGQVTLRRLPHAIGTVVGSSGTEGASAGPGSSPITASPKTRMAQRPRQVQKSSAIRRWALCCDATSEIRALLPVAARELSAGALIA
jgi:hypothetical protein